MLTLVFVCAKDEIRVQERKCAFIKLGPNQPAHLMVTYKIVKFKGRREELAKFKKDEYPEIDSEVYVWIEKDYLDPKLFGEPEDDNPIGAIARKFMTLEVTLQSADSLIKVASIPNEVLPTHF